MKRFYALLIALLMAAQVQKKIAAGYIKHGREGQAHADHRSGR